MEKRRATISLRLKIMILVVASVVSTALLIGGIDYIATRQTAFNNSISELASATRFASSNVKAAYEQMKNDVFAISRTPPVKGLIFSLRNNDVDPRDGSTTVLWRKRLGTIFSSFLTERSHYTQIRYIGIANNGRELVRVNRHEDGKIAVVPADALQEKYNESYFIQGAKTPPETYYLSQVTYNREHRALDPGRIPTIRTVLPVFDDDGKRFGMIVINADFDRLMRGVIKRMDAKHEVYISDSYGSYIHKDAAGAIHPVEVAGHYTGRAPTFIQNFAAGDSATGDTHFTSGDLFGYLYSSLVAPGQEHGSVGTFFLTPEAALRADADRLGNRVILISLLLVMAAIMITARFAHLVTRPMAEMTEKIRAFGQETFEEQSWPIEAKDEVGEMARAFRDLIESLDLSHEQNAQLSMQLETFIRHSVDGVIVIDDNGTIETVNPAAIKIFGYQPEELVGRNVSMLMPEPVRNAHDGYLQRYKETGEKHYLGTLRDEEAKCKDGSIVPISLAINEVEDKGRRIYVGMVRDMTAFMLAQAQKEKFLNELKRSNQELDQFAYIASHDLKAPLRVIDNTSSWLEEDLEDKLTEKDKKHLRVLRNRVQRMDKLLDDLLEYSRVGRAIDDRYSEKVSGTVLVADILALLAPPPGFHVEISSAFSEIVVARMPLQQVLYNLINNAIKHHDREAGTIWLDVERSAEQLSFSVRDDGPGIPSQYQKQVFDMFRTLKPRDQVEGSGMGLALVKKTVEYFGGTIELVSDQERGACFRFTWPVQQTEKSMDEAA